jgi:branched-chain amino acid aminotransferase
MASMRIVRMEIPMNFTMEYFEEQILTLVNSNSLSSSSRARITVYRTDGGYYLPKTNTVSFLIHAVALENATYAFDLKQYEVDLFKDFYIVKQVLSSIKTTNRILNITASIFANENGLDNCLLLNDSEIVETIEGIFLW